MEEIIGFGLISDGNISFSFFLDLFRKIMCGVYETSFPFGLGGLKLKVFSFLLEVLHDSFIRGSNNLPVVCKFVEPPTLRKRIRDRMKGNCTTKREIIIL